MKILVLNSGSSSQKSSLYELGGTPPEDPPAPLWEGRMEWHGDSANAEVRNRRGGVGKYQVQVSSRPAAGDHFLSAQTNRETKPVTCLGGNECGRPRARACGSRLLQSDLP